MEISVVIPVYNKEAYVKRCFRQLMAQDFDSFEVVAVDDGSTDRSGEICDKMAQQDQRIRIIHTENGGVTAARRRGMEESQGKYIMFVDSDDELLPGALRTMHQTIEESGADEVIATYYDQYGQLYDTGRRGFVDGEGIIHDLLSSRLGVCVLWGIIFRRELLEGCLDTPPQIRNGLPNDRKLQLPVERLYDETLRKTLEPRWDEFKHYHTQHQLKIYEDFVESRQWDACREYAKDIRPNVTSRHPLADRIAFFLPPRISYFLVHTYRWWLHKA